MAKISLTFMIASLAVSAPVATAAHAAERQRQVEYSDLDLSGIAGQTALKKRVDRAVFQVCASPSPKTTVDRADQKRCEARARIAAMRQVGQTIARHGSSVKVAID